MIVGGISVVFINWSCAFVAVVLSAIFTSTYFLDAVVRQFDNFAITWVTVMTANIATSDETVVRLTTFSVAAVIFLRILSIYTP